MHSIRSTELTVQCLSAAFGQMMLGSGADSYKTCLPGHQQQHDDPHEHQDDHVPDQQEHLLDPHHHQDDQDEQVSDQEKHLLNHQL